MDSRGVWYFLFERIALSHGPVQLTRMVAGRSSVFRNGAHLGSHRSCRYSCTDNWRLLGLAGSSTHGTLHWFALARPLFASRIPRRLRFDVCDAQQTLCSFGRGVAVELYSQWLCRSTLLELLHAMPTVGVTTLHYE